MKRSTTFIIMTLALPIAIILQVIGLTRYAGRLPDDWVGIGLYSATLGGFALAAVGFLIQWRKQRRVEKGELAEEEKWNYPFFSLYIDQVPIALATS